LISAIRFSKGVFLELFNADSLPYSYSVETNVEIKIAAAAIPTESYQMKSSHLDTILTTERNQQNFDDRIAEIAKNSLESCAFYIEQDHLPHKALWTCELHSVSPWISRMIHGSS
jgi:hypothetical protein